MSNKNTKFYELDLPIQDIFTEGNMWYIETTTQINMLLLNDEIRVEDINAEPLSRFYFETEFDAHAHAAGYYMNHGKKYPYISEMTCGTDDDTVVSQIMEF